MSNASTLVYISYARADRARVDPVVVALRERGFTLAVDPTSAHGAGDYVHESQRALQQANALVVFISQASAQSAWVEAETRAFQATMARGGARRLIPVRLDETLLPSALAVYTTVDGVSVAPAVLADTLAQTLGDVPMPLAPDAASGGTSAEPPILSQYSPTLIYDLATMSKLTGLRPLALWTFEQHLGIAQQAPLEAQDRASPRYSERDLVALNWLRDRIIAGEPTSDAAARLLVAQLDQPATPAPAMESTASVAVAEPPTALVYVACARADLARVEPAVAALRERGFNVHFDAAHAHGSGSYVHESQQALRQADAFVVFVSRAATQSAWVEAETRAFQATMARDDNRKLIPVRLDDSPLPLSLAHYSAIDGATATATALADAIASALDGAPAQPGEAAGETAVRGALASSAPDSGATWPAEEAERGAAADVSEPDTAADIPAPAPAPEPAPSEALPAPAPAAPPAPPLVAAPVLPPPVTPQPITQPGGSRQTTGAPAPKPAPAARAVASAGGAAPPQSSSQEQVTFIAYHPREVPPQQWQPLVVYLSLDNAATMALVAAAAAERLAGRRDQFRPGRSAQATGLARGAALRIIPTMPGFEFNPGHLDVTWQEDVQQH
ncbi:MAG TPA: TIR domain-containing protein, partial [Ktedonobacterales bacterium]